MTPEEVQKRKIMQALMASMGGGGQQPAPMPQQAFPQFPRQAPPSPIRAPRQAPAMPVQGGAGQAQIRGQQGGDDLPPTPDELAELGKGFFDPETLRGLELNATEARNLGLAIRMMQAEAELRPREQLGTKFRERALEWLPGEVLENKIYGSGALGTNPEYQQYRTARDSFANAALRADTGATINESELPEIIRESMPLPGDTPETIDQKRRIREGRIRALMAGTGEQASAMLPPPGQPVIPLEQMSEEDYLKALGLE
jgi:hypothetical protein